MVLRPSSVLYTLSKREGLLLGEHFIMEIQLRCFLFCQPYYIIRNSVDTRATQRKSFALLKLLSLPDSNFRDNNSEDCIQVAKMHVLP